MAASYWPVLHCVACWTSSYSVNVIQLMSCVLNSIIHSSLLHLKDNRKLPKVNFNHISSVKSTIRASFSSSWQEKEDAAIVFALFSQFNSLGVTFRNLIMSPFQSFSQSSNLIKPGCGKSFCHWGGPLSNSCSLIKTPQFDTEARKWHCFHLESSLRGLSVGFV